MSATVGCKRRNCPLLVRCFSTQRLFNLASWRVPSCAGGALYNLRLLVRTQVSRPTATIDEGAWDKTPPVRVAARLRSQPDSLVGNRS